jgi:hypothetical protein
MSKSVLVLGVARSGTSMTAGMLSILGVEMHEKKGPPKVVSQNPKGAFENINFGTLTSKMHRALAEGKPLRIVKQQYSDRLAEMIVIHKKALWGFKSAATHHVLSIMLPLLEKPHLVVVVRSLMHNAQSWQIHMKDVYGKKVTLQEALKNMSESQHILMRNSLVADCPKLFTSYEGIKADPWGEAVRMAKFLEVDPEPQKQDILDFIMPKYSTLKTS